MKLKLCGELSSPQTAVKSMAVIGFNRRGIVLGVCWRLFKIASMTVIFTHSHKERIKSPSMCLWFTPNFNLFFRALANNDLQEIPDQAFKNLKRLERMYV